MTRIGIVGAGAIAGVHLDAWSQMPGIEIVGYYDIKPEAAQRAAARFGGRVFPTQAALMAEVDLIDICSPAAAHKENVLAGAAAGCAMICEKPLSRHLRDAEEMVAACAQAGVPLYVAHVVRFFAEYAKAQAVIASGAIGKPGVIRTVRVGSFPRAGKLFTSNFYGDFALSGGVILDLAIHDIDYQHWIGGPVERVYAQGLTFSGLKECDHSLIVLRFASGAVGHIEASWAHPAGIWRTRLEIAGDAGLVEWDALDTPPLLAHIIGEAGSAERLAASPIAVQDTPYYAELAHFVNCYQQNKPPRVTPQDALMALKIALAAIESERRGQPVKIDGFEEVEA